jgi:hypothetical protein
MILHSRDGDMGFGDDAEDKGMDSRTTFYFPKSFTNVTKILPRAPSFFVLPRDFLRNLAVSGTNAMRYLMTAANSGRSLHVAKSVRLADYERCN